MKRYFLAIIVLVFLFCPMVSAVSIPYCAHQDMFLWNSTGSDGNRVFINYPELDSQRTITSTAITSASGEVTLGTWTTAPFTSKTIIDPGLWVFHMYSRASSDSGTTTLKYRIFNITSSGTKTWLFFGNAFSKDIQSGTIPTEYITSYARRNNTEIFTGDRLGIQINISTDSAAARTVSLDLAGNTNASVVSVSYWICNPYSYGLNTSTYTSAKEGLTPLPVAVFIAIIGILALIGSILLQKETVGAVLAVISPFPLIVSAWQFMNIDIVTSYGVAALSSSYNLIENHTIYTIYAVSIILIVLFCISVLNIYRIIMASRVGSEED